MMGSCDKWAAVMNRLCVCRQAFVSCLPALKTIEITLLLCPSLPPNPSPICFPPLQDAWAARHCCTTLKHLAPLLVQGARQPPGCTACTTASSMLSRCYGPLCRVMLTRGLGETTWYSAAGVCGGGRGEGGRKGGHDMVLRCRCGGWGGWRVRCSPAGWGRQRGATLQVRGVEGMMLTRGLPVKLAISWS